MKDLLEFHREVKDEAILFNYAIRKFKDAQDELTRLFNTIPRKIIKCLPSCLAYLLNKIWIPVPSEALKNNVEREQAKYYFDRVEDAYQKLCCFSMYAERKPILEATSKEDNQYKNDKKYWITGEQLSWYEKK